MTQHLNGNPDTTTISYAMRNHFNESPIILFKTLQNGFGRDAMRRVQLAMHRVPSASIDVPSTSIGITINQRTRCIASSQMSQRVPTSPTNILTTTLVFNLFYIYLNPITNHLNKM
ncbi:MAG: hypothetical protein IPK03_15465 [Bacteroidetes bacterium]|nr:hypothetical protein [Bacteroidota bacterium]